MKNSAFTTVLAALIVSSLAVVQAAPKSRDNSPATKARGILEEVASLSTSMVNTADELAVMAKTPGQADTQLVRLNELRDDVNRIGKNLRVLEAEKGSLTAWESKTFDEILPLMKEIASNTETAMENYSSNRNYMWTTAFPDESAKVYADAERVKEILDDNLKLAKVREEEQHLEDEIGSN